MLAFWVIYAVLLLIFVSRPVLVGWDSSEYLAYGKWLFSGYGFRAEYRPPVWPLLLGALWKLGFPMPFTMKALTFLIYAAIPLVPLRSFEDSRRYIGLLIASHPLFASWTHLPLSHPIATLFFVLAYSSSGVLSGIFAAFSGLSRFTFLLYLPFICWKDRRRWAGSLSVLSLFFLWSWSLYGDPFLPLKSASELINEPEYLWFWEKEPWFYLKAFAFSPLLVLGFLSRSRFTISALASLLYFSFLPHKEFRFFIDVLPSISTVTVEAFNKLPLVIAAANLLVVPFFYHAAQLPPEAWDFIPDGATVVGMTPEVNAYRNVYFKRWFYPAEIPDAEYCIYFDSAIPCATESCREKKLRFRDSCDPLYSNGAFGLVVGLTRHPSAVPG